jgi:hypothetical protein
MKRILFFLFIAFSLLSTTAQSFKGGIRAGLTASQLSGDNMSGYNKLGAYAGGYVKFPFTEIWSLQTELNFIMKGSSNVVNLSPSNLYLYYIQLLYLQVPLLPKAQLFKNFELELGPAFNILFFGAEYDAYGRIHNRKPFKWWEISGIVGVTYLIKEHYGINIRYEVSLTPIRKADETTWYIHRRGQFSDLFSISFLYQF